MLKLKFLIIFNKNNLLNKKMDNEIPSYCETIDNPYINIIKHLLKSSIKSYNINNIKYGDLNPSIDYNQILSKILSNIDNAIECLIESDKDKALKYVEDCFLNESEIYDYIITSGIFNEFAKINKLKECPISSIDSNQKIIIKDMRKIKTSSISLNEIEDYYTDLKLVK